MRDTGLVFRLRRSSQDEIDGQILRAGLVSAGSPRYLSVEDGLQAKDLGSFVHDQTRSCLGYGQEVFAASKRAFEDWKMFDLGWVRVVNTHAPIAVGRVVAVEVRSLGLWSVNLSQILEAVDTETHFGFLYSTTPQHVEQGEETFHLRFNPATGEVSYELEAVSRPRQLLAKLGYPVTRNFQRRFARDSHQSMLRALGEKDRQGDLFVARNR